LTKSTFDLEAIQTTGILLIDSYQGEPNKPSVTGSLPE
jgi:hypothetical protein